FRYGQTFLDRLGPALELGRSFVRQDDQNGFAPLLLLWKGIGAFVARNPRYKTLIGLARPGLSDSGFDSQGHSTVANHIEQKQPRVPVLLRQYLKLGGKLLGLSEDPRLSGARDGLVVVDLTKAEPRLLERYLGKKETRTFLEFQAGLCAAH